MNTFAWALAGFVLIHVGVSATGLRASLVRSIGEAPYRAAFALVSIALLAWMIWGIGEMRADPFDPLNQALWAPPEWLRWPAYALVVLGLVLAFAGVLTASPTRMGNEKKGLAAAEPARGVVRITRHPFLWGVSLWAAGHLLVNGERFALMLFGALGLMVILGTRSIDRKSHARDPEGWDRFTAVTSNIPFAAIVERRNTLKLGEMAWQTAVAVVIVALLAWGHETLFGASIA